MSSKNTKKKTKVESDNENEDEDDYVDEEDEEEEEEDDDEEEAYADSENKECEIEDALEKDNLYFDNNEELEQKITSATEYVSSENRISINRLTKYEMVRIFGERTKQLTMGAKPLIKNYQGLNYEKIVEEEFKHNMRPYKIVRKLPNGTFEIWSLDELTKTHLVD
jgi:DNA-directed RNA polymerase subunit K/omega